MPSADPPAAAAGATGEAVGATGAAVGATGAAETPTPEAQAAAAASAARAVVPETAAGYALNVPEALKGIMNPEALATDPMIVAIREDFKAKGRTQGDFDTLFEAMGTLQEKGLISKPLDFAAERQALGENGLARQQEVETFAKSLKARGDIDESEFGELMSLAPTAAGVRLVEKLRKMTGTTGNLTAPGAEAPDAGKAAQDEAKALARDPKYGKDRQFTAAADAKWKAAFATPA